MPDQQTFRRAASSALLGLGVQFLLCVVIALLALWASSAGLKSEAMSLNAGALHLLAGLPIWLVLWMVYNQHRLERAEALEAQQLSAADAATSAIFESHADDLALARRRLENLYKWALPVVSLVVAAFLLIVGGWLCYSHLHQLDALRSDISPSVGNNQSLILLAVAAAVAFLGFVAARYLSGMTAVAEWQLLRGGASFLMGNAVVAALLALGGLTNWLGSDLLFDLFTVIVPGLMALIGLEIVLNFLLSAYRPRQPGEMPRPAFDSRLLGWLTSPESIAKIISETINYQFGIEVSKSWFYRLLSKAITPLVAAAILILLLISSFVVVQPDEQAVILTFGSLDGPAVGPGLHVKWPWPIGEARKYPVQRVQQIHVGSVDPKLIPVPQPDKLTGLMPIPAILWTNAHAGKEVYEVTAPGAAERALRQQPTTMPGSTTQPTGAAETATTAPGAGTSAGSGKFDPSGSPIIGADVVVQYRVRDLVKYITNTDQTASTSEAPRILFDLAERRTGQYFAGHDIDTLMAGNAAAAGDELRRQIQLDCDRDSLGVDILAVNISGLHPPAENDVAAAFHKQIAAVQEKQTRIEQARRKAIETMTTVAGSESKAQEINAAILKLEESRRELERARTTQPAATEGGAKVLGVQEHELAAQEAQVEALLASAQGTAAQNIYAARTERWRFANSERAAAEAFKADLAAYNASPRYYQQRLYWDMLGQELPDKRKYLFDVSQSVPPVIRFDFKDAASPLEGIVTPK